MMSTLENEVIEKFHQLDKDAKKRVRELILLETESVGQTDTSGFDYDAWWAEVENLQTDIRKRIGDTGTVGTLSLLDELREEAS
jgi:hypothetical protein